METINISLPKSLSVKIDRVIKKEGYASRSEFFRTILRLYLQLTKGEAPVLVPFKKRSLTEVKKELEGTGLYNQKFIKSVVSGLKKSSVYAN